MLRTLRESLSVCLILCINILYYSVTNNATYLLLYLLLLLLDYFHYFIMYIHLVNYNMVIFRLIFDLERNTYYGERSIILSRRRHITVPKNK